jgi:hypothetical protein
MHGNAARQQEYKETAEQPGSERHGEKPQKREFPWPWRPWRGVRVSVFWNFGIKIVRPKRAAVSRPTRLQDVDIKTIACSQETSA